MRRGSAGEASVRDFAPESRRQRLLTQARENRDRRIIGYTARMLGRRCHPFRRSKGKAVDDVLQVPESGLHSITNATRGDHSSG
jgi:hypothetical protein